jgi:lipoyl(octanoyl) transferase
MAKKCVESSEVVGLPSAAGVLSVEDLGRRSYAEAYELQTRRRDTVLARRAEESSPAGALLLVEHDPPVITISRRANASGHVLATPAVLDAAGVEVQPTDRGGDVTYHGPGQLVAYPILDLNRLGLNLHAYMRLLEDVVIAVCRGFGVDAGRDTQEPPATGVWVGGRKIAAMGVRVRKWVTMHGLALNVSTDLSHFDLIVPCGLAGREVTSLERELGEAPSMADVKRELAARLTERVRERLDEPGQK